MFPRPVTSTPVFTLVSFKLVTMLLEPDTSIPIELLLKRTKSEISQLLPDKVNAGFIPSPTSCTRLRSNVPSWINEFSEPFRDAVKCPW